MKESLWEKTTQTAKRAQKTRVRARSKFFKNQDVENVWKVCISRCCVAVLVML